MEGYGIFLKPLGYFSDDNSLTFALVESLIEGYDLDNIALNFVKWVDEGFWTLDGDTFDVGRTTRIAINNFKGGSLKPELCGGTDECSNGNGSLMRIAPLIFVIKDKSIEERFEIIKDISSITHRHMRTIIAFFLLFRIYKIFIT